MKSGFGRDARHQAIAVDLLGDKGIEAGIVEHGDDASAVVGTNPLANDGVRGRGGGTSLRGCRRGR